jgi:hypothetical protein
VGKLRDDLGYLVAIRQYEKARNQLASERVDMIMGMYGDRSKSFYSAGLDRDDEIDRMHTAWIKLRPHLTMIKGKVRWGSNLHKDHQLKFNEFKLHWDFHKKLQKK